MTTTDPNGRFCWHELHTTDVRKAVRFYGELLGWKAREESMGPGGTYTILSIGDRDVGGATVAAGAAPHWLPYAVATSIDATLRKAAELGAKVEVPGTDIPNVGRFAIFRDSEGARLGLLQPAQLQPETDARPPVGTFCWTELMAADRARATSFYRSLLGYQVDQKDMGPSGKYDVLLRGTVQTGGIMKSPAPGAPAAWLSYVAVDGVDAAAQRAERLGGKVMAPPTDIPGIGRFSVVLDPDGAAIAVFKGA